MVGINSYKLLSIGRHASSAPFIVPCANPPRLRAAAVLFSKPIPSVLHHDVAKTGHAEYWN